MQDNQVTEVTIDIKSVRNYDADFSNTCCAALLALQYEAEGLKVGFRSGNWREPGTAPIIVYQGEAMFAVYNDTSKSKKLFLEYFKENGKSIIRATVSKLSDAGRVHSDSITDEMIDDAYRAFIGFIEDRPHHHCHGPIVEASFVYINVQSWLAPRRENLSQFDRIRAISRIFLDFFCHRIGHLVAKDLVRNAEEVEPGIRRITKAFDFAGFATAKPKCGAYIYPELGDHDAGNGKFSVFLNAGGKRPNRILTGQNSYPEALAVAQSWVKSFQE